MANKILTYAVLVVAWLVLTTLQAQVEQQPDTLRFDPETGEPVKPKPVLKFDPETGLPVEAKPSEPTPEEPQPEEPKPTVSKPEEPKMTEKDDDEKGKKFPLLSQDLLTWIIAFLIIVFI